MQNQVLKAFFFGRALAEVLSEKVEDRVTNILSDVGKFDAEQRGNLRQFLEEVQARAANDVTTENTAISTVDGMVTADELQETLDKLRAEIASLKAELKTYRDNG